MPPRRSPDRSSMDRPSRRGSAAPSRGIGKTGAKKAAAAQSPKIPCPVCGKSFPTEAGMQTHQYAAHGEAPMEVGKLKRCTECGVLVREKRMSDHRLIMHGLK